MVLSSLRRRGISSLATSSTGFSWISASRCCCFSNSLRRFSAASRASPMAVPSGAGQRAQGARPHQWKDAPALHPYPPGGPGRRGTFPVRPGTRPNRLPLQVRLHHSTVLAGRPLTPGERGEDRPTRRTRRVRTFSRRPVRTPPATVAGAPRFSTRPPGIRPGHGEISGGDGSGVNHRTNRKENA